MKHIGEIKFMYELFKILLEVEYNLEDYGEGIIIPRVKIYTDNKYLYIILNIKVL